jgi:hypothetical protein
MSYKIIRFYRNDRKPKVMRKGLTLKEAQAHCNDPKTRKEGVYFDGYDEEKYKIIRMYRNGQKSRIIKKGLTLEQAQRHCSDPKTRKEGVWFDGWDVE